MKIKRGIHDIFLIYLSRGEFALIVCRQMTFQKKKITNGMGAAHTSGRTSRGCLRIIKQKNSVEGPEENLSRMPLQIAV